VQALPESFGGGEPKSRPSNPGQVNAGKNPVGNAKEIAHQVR